MQAAELTRLGVNELDRERLDSATKAFDAAVPAQSMSATFSSTSTSNTRGEGKLQEAAIREIGIAELGSEPGLGREAILAAPVE